MGMLRRLVDWLPSGPLTPVSAVLGWMWMLIGMALLVLPGHLVSNTTHAYLQDVPAWVFSVENLITGFLIAKPGCKHRTLIHFLGTLLCVNWIGVCLWPGLPWAHPHGNIAGIGIILWLALAVLINIDGSSMTYSQTYNRRHEGD